LTYETNTLAKGSTRGERMEDMYSSLKRFLDLAVISSKIGEGASLLLEKVHDSIDGMAIFEVPGKAMVHQFHSCMFLVALQGSVEE
jgi:hypothetical protein